ncbi:hypothetical protein CXR04_13850 [Streptomyces sp. CMB-StM0423]|nr:hypothetical protein CXR04_13850 [Streptomyces sp. CMB-StM0423]
MAALPAGSLLVPGGDTEMLGPAAMREMIGENPRINRTPDRLARFFDGLEMPESGPVSVSLWRPDAGVGAPAAFDGFGAVARKPSL